MPATATSNSLKIQWQGQGRLPESVRLVAMEDISTLLGESQTLRARGTNLQHVAQWRPGTVEAEEGAPNGISEIVDRGSGSGLNINILYTRGNTTFTCEVMLHATERHNTRKVVAELRTILIALKTAAQKAAAPPPAPPKEPVGPPPVMEVNSVGFRAAVTKRYADSEMDGLLAWVREKYPGVLAHFRLSLRSSAKEGKLNSRQVNELVRTWLGLEIEPTAAAGMVRGIVAEGTLVPVGDHWETISETRRKVIDYLVNVGDNGIPLSTPVHSTSSDSGKSTKKRRDDGPSPIKQAMERAGVRKVLTSALKEQDEIINSLSDRVTEGQRTESHASDRLKELSKDPVRNAKLITALGEELEGLADAPTRQVLRERLNALMEERDAMAVLLDLPASKS